MLHIVLACFVTKYAGNVAVDSFGKPVITLYTITADSASRAFDPATHVKGREQKDGLDIVDWYVVNFDAQYRGAMLHHPYRHIYRDLFMLIL
jgi:hypothetical protein